MFYVPNQSDRGRRALYRKCEDSSIEGFLYVLPLWGEVVWYTVYMSIEMPGSGHEKGLGDTEYRALGERIAARLETFRFPGLTEPAYQRLRAESEEFGEIAGVVHIDTVIALFNAHGAKIVVAENGNVFVMPANLPVTDTTLQSYSVFPKFLNATPDMDPDLKRLIVARR